MSPPPALERRTAPAASPRPCPAPRAMGSSPTSPALGGCGARPTPARPGRGAAASLPLYLLVAASGVYLLVVPPPPWAVAAWHSPAGNSAKLFLAGSACACLSHAGATPIDVLKTRLQTDPGHYSGLLDAAWKVTRAEGPGMLLQGLGPTAAGYATHGARRRRCGGGGQRGGGGRVSARPVRCRPSSHRSLPPRAAAGRAPPATAPDRLTRPATLMRPQAA